MTNAQIVKGFNRWMREFSRNPKAFQSRAEQLRKFRKERKPIYGSTCAALLRDYARG